MKSIFNNIDKKLFILSLVFVAFGYGMAAGKYQLFPYHLVNDAKDAALDWYENWQGYVRLQPNVVRDVAHRGPRLVRHEAGRAYEGVTLVPSFVDDSVALKLVDMEGESIHDWKVSLSRIWPDTDDYMHGPRHDWEVQIDDAVLFPNGDVVFMLSHIGLARMDRCGQIKWKTSPRYGVHHSVFLAESGNLWATGARVTNDTGDLANFSPPVEEETLIEVSPDGEVLREISILDVLLESDLQAVLLNGPELTREDGWDVTHINDVEVLGSEDAAAFPGFSAGDIMVSARTPSLIAVIDGDTEAVKWHQVGPYFRQHDPDFTPDGTITLFDNRSDNAEGTLYGGSRVLEIDPVTRDVTVVFAGTPDNPFYSEVQSAHQWLPNGNLLMTESDQGRLLEVDASGDVVWEYVDMWSDTEAVGVPRAQRYPPGFADFVGMPCPGAE